MDIILVLLVEFVCFLITGDAHMSPAVLADLWREEQDRIKILEEKMKVLLREKQVMWILWFLIQNFIDE